MQPLFQVIPQKLLREKDNQIIEKEENSTLLVDRPGNYTITATASGCTPSSANI